MRIQRGGKIALLVGHDLIGLGLVNELVPRILKLGCTPMIVNSRAHRNRTPKVPSPEIPAFYSAGIVDKILLPYLDSHPMQEAPEEGTIWRTYKQLSDIYKLDYIETDNVNDPDFLQKMQDDPDLLGGLTLRSLQVLEPQTIKVFEDKGFVWNLHGGSLPEYRGLLTFYHAIANRAETVAFTLHEIDPGIDTGAVIDKSVRPLPPLLSSVFNVYADMVPYASTTVLEALKLYLDRGTVRLTPQSTTAKSNYFTYPTSEQMDYFDRKQIHFVESPNAHISFIMKQFTHDTNSRNAKGLQCALIRGTMEWLENLDLQESFPRTYPPPTQVAQLKPQMAA